MDVVLTNARIYTSDEACPTADTLVVEGPRVQFVGDASDSAAAGASDVIDLQGRVVIPGLVDAHTHPAEVTKSRWHTRLPWTEDVRELLEFVRRYAETHPPESAPFLYFEYYPSTLFQGTEPTKHLIDEVVSDRPVLLQDFSEHSHLVNSRMLEAMGVDASTEDPVPGLEVFERDENGEPTGLIRESAYVHFLGRMFEEIGWSPPEVVTPENSKPFLELLRAAGVTAVFEAFVDDDEAIESMAALDEAGELHLFYEGSLRFRNSQDLPAVLSRLSDLQVRCTTPHVRIRTLKLFLDGTNESANSAVLEPFRSDDGDDSYGSLAMGVDELSQCLTMANDADVDFHIHLVGDRAFRVACDAVEQARATAAAQVTPWRCQVTFAHCELIDPADMVRPSELGIFVNWTPHWSGGYFGEEARSHLGDERWNRMYRFNELIDHGTVVTFGSDVVTSYEAARAAPLFGMQIAATRVDPQYPLDPDVHPRSARPAFSGALSIPDLLRGYTIEGARQLRRDDLIGSLTPGKLANFVVLDADPHSLDPADIAAINVEAVVFEGQVVFGALPTRTVDARSGSAPSPL